MPQDTGDGNRTAVVIGKAVQFHAAGRYPGGGGIRAEGSSFQGSGAVDGERRIGRGDRLAVVLMTASESMWASPPPVAFNVSTRMI